MLGHELADRTVASCDLEFDQQVRKPDILHGKESPYCSHTQSTGQISLTAASSSQQDDIVVLLDVIAGAEPTEPVPEVTEPEPVVVTPKPEEKEQPNLLPLLGVLLVAGIGGGAFFLMKAKGKQKDAAKPDPDADYVDDDEDFGYVEEEAEDLDFTDDSVDTEPV